MRICEWFVSETDRSEYLTMNSFVLHWYKLIGLFTDLLLISPIGIGFLIYLTLHYFVISQRATLLNRGLTVKLAVFTLVMIFLYFIVFFLARYSHGSFPAVKTIIVPCLATIICFIPFYRLFEIIDNFVFPSALRG